jgi:hypothetical protein
VAALGAVEEVEGVLFLLGLGDGVLLGGGVHVGVGDAGGLAEEVDAGAVPEAYEDGEGSAEDDVAGTEGVRIAWSVSFWLFIVARGRKRSRLLLVVGDGIGGFRLTRTHWELGVRWTFWRFD